MYVQRPLYDKFKEEFVKRTKALRVGNPLDTNQGAVVSKSHF
ncbi:MAG: aldehyde dehydrogenase family protein [Saprospiraceae bacterium]